jgi:uncharacterized membrane protein
MDFVILRLIHVVAGAFWLGAAVTMFLFLQPTAQATAPESQRFMLHLLRNRRFSEVVLGAALLTAAAGAILFWRDTGFELESMTHSGSLGFSIGGLAGGLALLLFVFVGYPAGRRMIAVGDRLETERRPPSEDEQQVLSAAQRILGRVGVTVLLLLVIAAAAMATARYWPLIL